MRVLLAREAALSGIGFFHGADVNLRLLPAEPDAGIRFACSKLHSMRAGEMGFSTSEVGDLVVEGMTA